MSVYFGAGDGDWTKSQLATVEAVDAETGYLKVTYLTCPGAEPDVLFIHTQGFSASYGIFATPTIGSVVEVSTLHDNTRIARPAFIQFKREVGSLSVDSLEQEVTDAKLYPLEPGEMVLLSDAGGQILMNNTGGVIVSDSGGSTLTVDTDDGGVKIAAVKAFTTVAADSRFRFGTVRRFKPTTMGFPMDDEYDQVPGLSPFQEFGFEVNTAQAIGANLLGVSARFGDIFSGIGGLIPNPLLMGELIQSNILGLTNTRMNLYRSGGYDVTLGEGVGILAPVYNAYGVVPLTGAVLESNLGTRTLLAGSLDVFATTGASIIAPAISLDATAVSILAAVEAQITAPAIVLNAPTVTLTGALILAASTVASNHPLDIIAPRFSVTSPNTEFSGNQLVNGNTVLVGAVTTQGTALFAGATAVLGAFASLGALALTGVPAATPLAPLSAVGFIPVTIMVAGVPVVIGNIPVVP